MSDQKDQLFRDLHTKKEEQLFKAVRVGSDYHADKLRRSNRELFDHNAIQKDISDINKVLAEKELGLMSEERSRLEMIKGRNLSSLLILDEKTTGDSSDMKAVKKSVAAIEGELDQKRKSPFTEKKH